MAVEMVENIVGHKVGLKLGLGVDFHWFLVVLGSK